MLLSTFSLWGSLLTLVASQSCPDPSEHSMRLKPLGQCKEGESMCPYRLTLPPFTVQLPKSFRELDKMTRELQSLIQMVNQLKEDCRECKENQRMDWNIQTDDAKEDEKMTQASRGTFNTKERQQDIAKRENTVQVTTSRSATEDTSDEKDVDPTAFGKQRTIKQERIINPYSSKPSADTNGSNPLQKNLINRSQVANLAESDLLGDLDSERPTQHEKGSIDIGHEINPSDTVTAKGKVKSLIEYNVDTTITDDDNDNDNDDDDYAKTKQLQKPKGNKTLEERIPVTGTHAQNNREFKPNMKQPDKNDKKEAADTRIKEPTFNTSDGTTNGKVAKEGWVTKKTNEKNNPSDSSSNPEPFEPGVYSQRSTEMNSGPDNTTDTISGQKTLTSQITGRANASVNVSLINTPTLEIKSKSSFKADRDAKLSIETDSKMNKAERETGQATIRLPISGITYGIVDASRTNPQIDNKKQSNNYTKGKVSETGVNLNPVYVDTVSGLKDSRLPNSGRANLKADVELIIPTIHRSNFQTPFRDGVEAGSNNGMDSKLVNGLKDSRLPSSGITDGTVNVRPTYPQVLDSNNRFNVGTDSEHNSGIDSNPVQDTETVSGLKISESALSGGNDGIDDVNSTNPQTVHSKNKVKAGTNSESDARLGSNLSSNAETVSGQKMARYDGIDYVSPKNLEILDNKTQFKSDTYSESDAVSDPHTDDAKNKSEMDSRPIITAERVSQIQTPNLPISVITDAEKVNQTYPGTLDGTLKKPLKPNTDAERKAERDSNPLTKVETHNRLQMPQTADDTVQINNLNLHMLHRNSEKVTLVSTPVNSVETVSVLETPISPISGRSHATTMDQINPQAMDHTSENLLKPGTISQKMIYPYQNPTAGTVSQRESTDSIIADSRLTGNNTNPRLNRNDDQPKRQLLPKSKLNMTQTRNGRNWSSNPVSIDTYRTQTLRNNKTTSLRNYAMTSGRHLPPGLVPMKLDKHKKITNHTEKNNHTRISPSKDPSHKKTYILQRRPVNESKAYGSKGPKNTTGVGNNTRMRNGTTHVYSKTVSSANEELNSTAYVLSQSVRPTLTTHGVVYQAYIKSRETTPASEVLNTINRLIESTSQTIVISLDKPRERSLQQDVFLDSVNNIGKDSRRPAVEETAHIDKVAAQTPLKTSSADYNHKKQLEVEGVQIQAVAQSESNKLVSLTTTAVTSYTKKTEFKGKDSKTPRVTPPTIKTPRFMNRDHAEIAKTTSQVSNKHVYHRLKNPSQDMEPKRFHSDIGTKELQTANNSQGSGNVRDLRPNASDSIQNRAVGSSGIIKAITGAKVSTTPTESTRENIENSPTPSSTEVNRETSSNNAPVMYHRNSKTLLGSSGSKEGNNGGHSVDTNNGNSDPATVNRMTEAILHKIQDGHINSEVTKPLIVNNMDGSQGLKNQLLSKCDGLCHLSPTPWSDVKSHESSDNDRGKPFQDCSDFIMRNPTSGIYNVTPNGSGNRTFPVFCDMKTSGGGWTLIQHRFDGSISFNRTWNDYKRGFGNLKGELWLGNDKIHWLTTTKAMVLRIELEDLDGLKEYAQYDHFHVANESQHYRLTIEGYSGTAGDSMRYSKKFNHNKKNFTTPDRDNDQYTSGNCGAYYSSGWWFDACMAANLNGKYYKTRYRGVRNGIFWGTWHNIATESYLTRDRQSFKTVKMLIRPRKI